MDDLLKPNDEMLLTLATELGLMSIVAAGPETAKPQPEIKPLPVKGATLT
jgi:hypothetical protein